MRVVLDVNILVRVHEKSSGLARDLLRAVLETGWTLLISGEMLVEVARVLRYPRLQERYGLADADIYNYVQFLRQAAEFVEPDATLAIPIRDAADIAVVQTAITGEAEIICTLDADFFEPSIAAFLSQAGILAVDDVALMKTIRSDQPPT